MYKKIIELLKSDLEDLKENLIDDDKLMMINDDVLMKDINDIENAIENIEGMLNENNRI